MFLVNKVMVLDQIPIFSDTCRNDRLYVENVDNRILGPVVKRGVVFKRQADEGTYRVL
jgi:hypothetical protein